MRVCVLCGRAILNSTRDNFNPHFFEFRKHPRSTATVQQQQQRYNTNEPRNAHIYRNACVPPFQLVMPSGFPSQPHPEGEPCTMYISCLRCTMCFQVILCTVFFFLFPEVSFHYRVIGACPVPTDWIFGDELVCKHDII